MSKPDCIPWMTEENQYQVKLLGECWVSPEQIARALLEAHQRGRHEGMEEAAKIASPNHGAGIFNEYEKGRRDAAAAIRSAAKEIEP